MDTNNTSKNTIISIVIIALIALVAILLFTQTDTEKEVNEAQDEATTAIAEETAQTADELEAGTEEAFEEAGELAQNTGDAIKGATSAAVNRLGDAYDATLDEAQEAADALTDSFAALGEEIDDEVVFDINDEVYLDGGYYLEVEDYALESGIARIQFSIENESGNTVLVDPTNSYLVNSAGDRFNNPTFVDAEIERELLSSDEYLYTVQFSDIEPGEALLFVFNPGFTGEKAIFRLQ